MRNECININFLLFKLNTLQKDTWQSLSQPKPWLNDSGVLNLHHGYFTTIMTLRRLFRHNRPSMTWYKSANQKIGIPTVYENLNNNTHYLT